MKQIYLLVTTIFLISNAVTAQSDLIDLIYHVDSGEGVFTTKLDGTSKNLLTSYSPSSTSLAHDIELDVDNSHMFVLDQNGKNLRQYNLNGTNNTLIYSYTTVPRDIELDLINQKIYHVVNGEVFTTNLDGTNKNSLITYTPSATNLLNGIELDLINNYIYILDTNGDNIIRYDLNGNNSTVVYNYTGGTQYPTDFALDVENNKIYHISRDNTAAEIFTTDLLGNSKTVLSTYTAGASLLYIDIELDTKNNHMYLLSTNGDLLDRFNLDGTNKTQIQTYSGSLPKDIVLYIIDPALSLNDTKINDTKIAVYPNPSSNYIQILGHEKNKEETSFSIYNINGAKVKNGIIKENEQIDIKDFSNGIYFLKLDNKNAVKFIKK
ncbi:T9SS type A sorting domain-containing protein [Mesoflavibacter sp.]|uniref:T9SS type A sorting domain-containing protein n=1 Tax=Mesoflavibacter sp. TaxID=1930902 RepID=UPI0035162283